MLVDTHFSVQGRKPDFTALFGRLLLGKHHPEFSQRLATKSLLGRYRPVGERSFWTIRYWWTNYATYFLSQTVEHHWPVELANGKACDPHTTNIPALDVICRMTHEFG